MSEIWIIGRKATMATNGHEYISTPFIAFHTEAEALRAREMIEKVSGEKVMITSAALMNESEPRK